MMTPIWCIPYGDCCWNKENYLFCKSLLFSMDITSLSSVKPGKFTYRIRVQICRTWRAIRYASEQYNGLHCVMIDQEGTSIHGFMPEDQVEDMIQKPIQGKMYEIHQFSTRQHNFGLRVVPNSVIVHFNGRTIFCKVAETIPAVPIYCFRLISFASLDSEREAHSVGSSHAVLTDVCGCIKSIRPPHPQFMKTQNKYGVKCEIILENLERETLTIVLWGKLARDFNVRAITSLPSPVIAVFTGLKITQFNHRVVANNYDHTCLILNPSTDWADDYKTEFSRPGDKPMILGDFHVFQTTEKSDPLSVQGLTGLDPFDYKGTSVLCKGQIIKIGTQGWWYRRCPERSCYKQCFKVEEFDGKYRCKIHGIQSTIPCFRVNILLGDEFSDINVTVMGNQAEQLFGFKLEALRSKQVYLTEQVLPPEIAAVIGQVHIFELKGNTYGEWVAIGVEPSGDNVSMTASVENIATSSATQISETALQPLEKNNTTTASTAFLAETPSQIPEKTNTATDPSTLPLDIELHASKKVDTTTPSSTQASGMELQTPDKTCLQPKRTGKNISKTLFPESKKTRRETEEMSMSSSTSKEKDKLD